MDKRIFFAIFVLIIIILIILMNRSKKERKVRKKLKETHVLKVKTKNREFSTLTTDGFLPNMDNLPRLDKNTITYYKANIVAKNLTTYDIVKLKFIIVVDKDNINVKKVIVKSDVENLFVNISNKTFEGSQNNYLMINVRNSIEESTTEWFTALELTKIRF